VHKNIDEKFVIINSFKTVVIPQKVVCLFKYWMQFSNYTNPNIWIPKLFA